MKSGPYWLVGINQSCIEMPSIRPSHLGARSLKDARSMLSVIKWFPNEVNKKESNSLQTKGNA